MNRWLLRPAPPAPLAALRVVVGVWAFAYLALRAPDFAGAGGDVGAFRPVGVVSVVLDRPYSSATGWALVLACLTAGAGFVAGWRFRLCGPAFAVLLLWVTTWRSSWTQVFHTENLLVLHVVLLAQAPSADVWSLDGRRRRRGRAGGPPREDVVYGWPVRAMALVTALAYVLAGVAKLRHGGVGWLSGEDLRNWVAYDNLRKIELGDRHSPVGPWLAARAWLWGPVAVFTLCVELGAPLALLGGRAARAWAAAAWLFHVGVLALMAILFPYPLTGVAFAPLLCLAGRDGEVALPPVPRLLRAGRLRRARAAGWLAP